MEKILSNSIVSLIGVIIAGLGVAFEIWISNKVKKDENSKELLKEKFALYKNMYLKIVFPIESKTIEKEKKEEKELIKSFYENLYKNQEDKLVLLDGNTIKCFESFYNDDSNTDEGKLDKKIEKVSKNIKKEYKSLKLKMKYPTHYSEHLITNISYFVMIAGATGLWALAPFDNTDIACADILRIVFLIVTAIAMCITVFNIRYISDY